jgi:hypothetical protein
LAEELISIYISSHGTEMSPNFQHQPEIIWSPSVVYITALNFSYEPLICSPLLLLQTQSFWPLIQTKGCVEREAHSLTVVVKLIRKEKRVGFKGWDW